MYLPLPGCVALHQNELWIHGAVEAAADWSQGSHSETDIFVFGNLENQPIYPKPKEF